METLYWLCFVIGGLFVLLAVVGGFDGADFDGVDLDGVDLDGADLDGADLEGLEGEMPLETDLEVQDPGDGSPPRKGARFSPLSSLIGILGSLKFWTFGICFFGLTGLVLSNVSAPPPPQVITIVAIAMGVICGGFIAGALRILRYQNADSLVKADDVVGVAGVVTLPFDRNSRGKVQIKIKGAQLERIAYTDEARTFQPGDQVLIVGIEQDRLWVVSAPGASAAALEAHEP
jgi:hypothetical protein